MTTIPTRVVLATLSLTAVTTGCATQSAYLNEGPTALGKPPYQVGPVTVAIRSQAEVELICRLRSSRGAPVRTQPLRPRARVQVLLRGALAQVAPPARATA